MALMVFLAVLLSVVLASGCSNDKDMPVDCSDVYKSGQKLSGIYSIYPAGDFPVWVYCDMISDGKDEDNGGWTVIQRRMDGSVSFYRPWNQYKRGFGKVESEYWLGDSLSGHNGYKCTTFDKDQDIYDSNCARHFLGGFWYSNCHSTNPNGVYLWGEDDTHYAIGNVWSSWKNNYVVGMKSISMKIRRVS